ncbi:tail fiber assembly protein [Pantoea septica]|uniref:tail fiber assembly protein n=1 Tax=Pantoea septica TaxID=472695 RepID=UPI00289FA1CE|nr:tail fiber assembly protein [Pantoea septica]
MSPDNAYAVVKNNVVVNMIVWDGKSPTDFGETVDGDLIQSGSGVGIGWLLENDGIFTAPPLPEKTQDEMVAEAEAKRSALMQTAGDAITPLQDAEALGMATDDEKAQLAEWRKYRVLLNRIDTSLAPGISWPVKPT